MVQVILYLLKSNISLITGGGAADGNGGVESVSTTTTFGTGGTGKDAYHEGFKDHPGGGGGGDYYGGVGGANFSAGGYQGSNYVTGLTSASTANGNRSGSGYAAITLVSVA